jgi:hypothetical protein
MILCRAVPGPPDEGARARVSLEYVSGVGRATSVTHRLYTALRSWENPAECLKNQTIQQV